MEQLSSSMDCCYLLKIQLGRPNVARGHEIANLVADLGRTAVGRRVKKFIGRYNQSRIVACCLNLA